MRLANEDMTQVHREAAEVHRQVRNFAHQIIRPGIHLTDLCEQIENMNRRLVGEAGLEVS